MNPDDPGQEAIERVVPLPEVPSAGHWEGNGLTSQPTEVLVSETVSVGDPRSARARDDLGMVIAISPPEPPIGPGTHIGDYELIRKIATGGMGTVWEARNTKNRLNLPVALKMIRAGEAASEADIQQFLDEARSVASLHSHPHIVKIYGIGNHGDQYYFAMQLIRGGSVKQKLDEYRRDRRAAVRLMIQVADAITYVHRRGVLHRDLKPDNILLDESGTPFVTDFGLAKRVQPAPGSMMLGQTPTLTLPLGEPSPSAESVNGRPQAEVFSSQPSQIGSILGTPSYMPPEQAKGLKEEISTLSDVYSLGAVLYELLTGQAPFTGTDPLVILRRVTSDPPRPLRELDPTIDRDLEAICLKCLEKAPSQRYDSAEAFSRDLQRWLELKPVKARPSTHAERLVKWARREPGRATGAALIGLVLALTPLVLILTLGLENHRRRAALASARARSETLAAAQARAEKAQIQAQAEKAAAQAQAEKAENRRLAAEKAWADASFAKANETIDTLINAVENELGADPAMQPLRRTLLRLAVDHFADAARQWQGDRAHMHDLALASVKVAEFARKLGDPGQPETTRGYEEAIAAMETLLASNPNLSPTPPLTPESVQARKAELASFHHEYGVFLMEGNHLDPALNHLLAGLRLREELSACEAHHDPTCPTCLNRDNADLRAELARSHGYLGDVYLLRGQHDEANAAYQTSHEIRLDLARAFSSDQERLDRFHFQLARSFGNLATMARFHGDLRRAIDHQEQARSLQRALVSRAESTLQRDPAAVPPLVDILDDYAASWRMISDFLIEDDRPAEAFHGLDEAETLSRRLIDQKPGRLKSYLGLARTQASRALAALEVGRHDESRDAVAAALRTFATIEDLKNDKDYRLGKARAHRVASRLALLDNQDEEAARELEQALDLLQDLVAGGDDQGNFDAFSDLGETMAQLGLIRERLGQRREALSWLKSAVERQERARQLAPDSTLTNSRLERHRGELTRLQEADRAGPGQVPPP
jgi:serine/threonine protein kinase